MITGNEPINPTPIWGNESGMFTPDSVSGGSTGLTKREYFAAKAMQGLCANHNATDTGNEKEIKWAALVSVEMADALIAELNK